MARIRFYARVLSEAGNKSPVHLEAAERWLCRNDLFYLLVVACGRKDMNHDWIFARCEEVFNAPNGYLDLWAREHYKSTIITFGMSILDILASHGNNPEPRYNGREVTIGILSFNKPTARGFLRQIKTELETNQKLHRLFPDVLWSDPKRQARGWSEDAGIIVKRASNPKEATVEGHGLVDGQPTGKHFLGRVYDDVVTRESVYTPEAILKTTNAWELSDNLGTAGGFERMVGTRYHLFDTYATMKDRGIPVRVHPCTSDGSEDWSKAVLKDPAELADKRRKQGPYTFGAQMLLNPTADRSQGFDIKWLTDREIDGMHAGGLNTYLLADPANAKRRSSDYTSMWVIGVDAAENWYLLDAVRDRLNLVERQLALFRLHKKWRPLVTAYEEYGLQADIQHMEYVMAQTNYRFTITPVGGQMKKEDRIKRLVPMYEAGRVYSRRGGILYQTVDGLAIDVMRVFKDEEFAAFPVTNHDDMLDCQARMFDISVTYPLLEEQMPEELPKWMQDYEAETLTGQQSFLTR